MITITDIAARAGVARSTVSYVLNERNTTVRISAKTRQRVIEASRELGYRRNELARAMITGKNSVLGFWVMDSQREPDVRILAGAMKEAEANDYFIKMLSLDSSGDASEIAEHCIDWRLSGIIAINPSHAHLDYVLPQISQFRIPLVMVEGEGVHAGCLRITSEQEQGIREAIIHLAALGHRKVAFLGGTTLANNRALSYQNTMRELSLESQIEVVYSEWSFLAIQQACLHLLERNSTLRPTAICCVCDHVAMILISTAGQLGLRIPQELAVTGFDDLTAASIYNPPLTTIKQPFEEMGRLAVRRLLSLAEKPEETGEKEEKLSTQLAIRGSTAALNQEVVRHSPSETELIPFINNLARAPNSFEENNASH